MNIEGACQEAIKKTKEIYEKNKGEHSLFLAKFNRIIKKMNATRLRFKMVWRYNPFYYDHAKKLSIIEENCFQSLNTQVNYF